MSYGGLMPYQQAMEQYESFAGSTRSFRRIIRRFEAQNSMLIGEDVFHSIISNQSAPIAETIGTDITFNATRLPSPDTTEDIMYLTGVNNHELGHVKYSPTAQDIRMLYPGATNDLLNGLLHRPVYAHVANILEDQRIEMLMCKRYANMRPYYITMFNRFIMRQIDEKPELAELAYLWARGRRYLPVKLRRKLKKKFRAQGIVPDVRRIIDGYCKLNLFTPDGMWKAHKLTAELLQLMEDHNLLPQTPPDEEGNTEVDQEAVAQMDPCGHLSKTAGNRASGQQSAADRADTQDVQKTIAAVAQDIDQDSGAQGSDNDAGASEDDGQGSSKGKDAEDVQDPSGDADDGGTGTGASKGDSESAGNGAGSEEPPSTDEIRTDLNALVEEQQSQDEVKEDVRQAELYIRTTRDVAAPRLRETARVTPDMPALARRVATALRVEEAEADPYWLGGQTSGRLDVQTVMRGGDREYAFNRWTDGGYGGNDQEWVILLDCSGSMDSHLHMLSEANWVMKKAADAVEAKMTTIAFGSTGQLVYGPEDKASTGEMPLMVDLGGTSPGNMLFEAHTLLTTSKRKQRGLIILTDGAWHHTPITTKESPFRLAEDVIKDLNNHNVLTHLVYFGAGGYSTHNCRTHGGIGELSELPKIFKDLVKSRMTKAH